MTGSILIAPEYENVEGPLIFLAGPIQGAYNWQEQAISLINSLDSEMNIASPRRRIKHEGEFTENMYNEQVDWETHYLNRAAEKGAVMFWLAKESEHVCHRAYAQTSRFELAEWKVLHQIYHSKMVVGIEEGFTGHRYIEKRFSQDCPEVPVLSSLEETCTKAVEFANQSRNI